jgi:hypothetical protein
LVAGTRGQRKELPCYGKYNSYVLVSIFLKNVTTKNGFLLFLMLALNTSLLILDVMVDLDTKYHVGIK